MRNADREKWETIFGSRTSVECAVTTLLIFDEKERERKEKLKRKEEK